MQRRLVAEPARDRDDDLVRGIGQESEGERDRTERPLRHRDVFGLERQSELRAQSGGDRLLRHALAGLVPEPVHRSGLDLRTYGVGEAGQRHLVRVPEREIQRAGIIRESTDACQERRHDVHSRLRLSGTNRYRHGHHLRPQRRM